MHLPQTIQALIAGEPWQTDDIGQSGSSVRIYHDKVLKIQEYGEEAENECRMMRYLSGKLPVPAVYAHEVAEGKSFLLMGKCDGRMACDAGYMQDQATLCRLLAKGLKMLWSVDISDCPSDWRLSRKLKQARFNVENGLVDLDNVEPGTFGENGFQSPSALLQWLCENMPEEMPVLSHGDYCLPNLFGTGDHVTGFIDLGKTGIADMWCDIALCWRSLSHNYSGKYAQGSCSSFDENMLFDELGIEPDWEKIRYYILLDELF